MTNIEVDSRLKAKVTAKLNECKRVMRQLGTKVDVREVTFEVPKNPRVAGTAFTLGNINLNPIFLNAYGDEFIDRTVVHEFAHLAVAKHFDRVRQAHGPEFRTLMRKLGADPTTYHNYDLDHVKHLIGKTAGRKYRTFDYRCTECSNKFVFTSIRHNKQLRHPNWYRCQCGADIKFVGKIS